MSVTPVEPILVDPNPKDTVEVKVVTIENDNTAPVKSEEEKTENNTPADYMKVQTEGSSLVPSILNMMNTIVGAGVLSIPLTVKKAGLVGSFIVLACSLFLSLEGAKMLSTAAVYTKAESYGMVANRLNQPFMGVIGDWAMIIFDLGVSVAYMIILFSQAMDLIENWGGVVRETLNNYYPLVGSLLTLFIAFPLLCIPSIDSLKFTSTAAVICICLFVSFAGLCINILCAFICAVLNYSFLIA